MNNIIIDRALLEQALDYIVTTNKSSQFWLVPHSNLNKTVSALKAALAQEQDEPVAWRTFDGEGGYDYRSYEDNEDYAAEWAQRNPQHAGWVEPLYPPPPKFVPLTVGEIDQAANNIFTDDPVQWWRKLARAVERKLEEKNGR